MLFAECKKQDTRQSFICRVQDIGYSVKLIFAECPIKYTRQIVGEWYPSERRDITTAQEQERRLLSTRHTCQNHENIVKAKQPTCIQCLIMSLNCYIPRIFHGHLNTFTSKWVTARHPIWAHTFPMGPLCSATFALHPEHVYHRLCVRLRLMGFVITEACLEPPLAASSATGLHLLEDSIPHQGLGHRILACRPFALAPSVKLEGADICDLASLSLLSSGSLIGCLQPVPKVASPTVAPRGCARSSEWPPAWQLAHVALPKAPPFGPPRAAVQSSCIGSCTRRVLLLMVTLSLK